MQPICSAALRNAADPKDERHFAVAPAQKWVYIARQRGATPKRKSVRSVGMADGQLPAEGQAEKRRVNLHSRLEVECGGDGIRFSALVLLKARPPERLQNTNVLGR